MNIFLTGGAGYIGSVLTKQLLKKRHNISVFDNFQFGGESLIDVLSNKKLKIFRGDIRKPSAYVKALQDIDCVVHLAALVGEPACKIDSSATRAINVTGAKKLCDLAKKSGVKRFIHISTCSNYGISDRKNPATEEAILHPLALYAKTKIAAEKYIIKQSDKDFSVCVLRLATVYGISPRMRFDLLVNEIVRDAYVRNNVTVYQPDAWRPFIHVTDVARAIVTCIDAKKEKVTGQVFNVGCKNYQKKEIIAAVKKYIPQLKEEIMVEVNDNRDYNVSFEKMKNVLGFQAKVSLETGIAEILRALNSGIFKDPNDYRYSNVGWPDQ